MNASEQALRDRLAIAEREVTAWAAKKTAAQRALDEATTNLQRHEADRNQLRADLDKHFAPKKRSA